ncbi:AAA family ATPase [Pseudoflavitalea rhizosphaerae]|uniref:AAA family ATPase n=1 Tax=Pseudoflavitalea rhizosphaerae TaxID=1884793 RepID=UPI000F8D80FC|nr:AAA family ATPase [Pseudoflavitalea rhizosphaerae]
MAFDPSKIAREHVLSAVDLIERENIPLKWSTGYEVVIYGKYYPPKEIIRYSYKIATGEDIGVIHGGEQVNAPLRNLGFEIIPKAKIWKLGCNWGKGEPNFYEAIKARQIVIGHISRPFEEGDLVLITEGFTVYAIAKLKVNPTPISTSSELEEMCSEHKIPFEEQVFYADAEWYILKETEIFQYELQQGIVQVRNKDIKEKAINLWENRNEDLLNVKFYRRLNEREQFTQLDYPCFIFSFQNIRDGEFQGSYKVTFYRAPKDGIKIGFVKFLQVGTNKVHLPKTFESLPETICSLGDGLGYYRALKSELPAFYEKVLTKLNDCAFHGEIREAFETHPGFSVSLLRTSEAELALFQAKYVLSGRSIRQEYEFTFSHQLKGAETPHKVSINFNMNSNLPNRFVCIVGKNGTGKTQIINQLAKKLYDETAEGEFLPERPVFSKIIAVTFSYFDHFSPPEKAYRNYEFIGIAGRSNALSENEIGDLIWNSFKVLSQSKRKKAMWLNAIKSCMEEGYLDFNLEDLLDIRSKEEFIRKTYSIFSSGQKIVFQLMTRLISIIEDNSLIIFDEPETHLHPNIAGRMIRALKSILDKSLSFGILATHSPVIVQEVPSMFIKVFDRRSNIPVIYSPAIECFGENLSQISNSIFGTEKEKELYKYELERLVQRKMSLSDINLLFDNKLSLNAQLYIQTLIS